MEQEIQKMKTGTTTVGIKVKDAVVLAADRQETLGYLVASGDAQKIHELDEHIAMTTAGGSADNLAIIRYLRAEYRLYKYAKGRRISVKAAVSLLSNILNSYKYYPFIVQPIIGGFDNEPRLFSLDSVGAVSPIKRFFSTGSGSPMALGVLEDLYGPEMTEEEGIELAVKAVHSATKRDIASDGSGIDIFVIDKKGIRKSERKFIKSLSK